MGRRAEEGPSASIRRDPNLWASESQGRDSALEQVLAALLATDRFTERLAQTIRLTLDQLYDGQHTGRYRWDQLHKTEKTHCGTVIEINLQREFNFADGLDLDFKIADHDVDCKYSQRYGGWMIPNEAHDQLCIVATADDAAGTWSAGLVRARTEWLNLGRNRDAKATLSEEGRSNIIWFARGEFLPPNVLLSLSRATVDRILGHRHGTKRVDELFRAAQRRRVGRGVVATVAQQSDYMKRIRENGGSRTALQPEGIVIFGAYGRHLQLAIGLGLERLGPGESMSARLAPAEPNDAWAVQIDNRWWRLAEDDDEVVLAPTLPKVSERS